MIVVDVGAKEWGDEESVRLLASRFRPETLFAFDIHPEFDEGMEWLDAGDGFMTLVERRRAAAWTEEGTVEARLMGICTGVNGTAVRPYERLAEVPCFDLCAFLDRLEGEIVLKLDCEGSEYPLLEAIAEQGLDERLKLVIVEWHDGVYAHGLCRGRRPQLRCPVEEWGHPDRPTPRGPTSRILRSFDAAADA